MSRRLTIAIPFYEGPDYLKAAVESVRAQDRSDWDLLVVDDGHSDQGIEHWLQGLQDPRIAYRRNPENLGMVATWNRCIDQAPGELVTLLHGDDLLQPGYASLVVGLAGAYPEAAAVCCDASIIDAGGRPTFSLADAVKPFFRPGGPNPLVIQGEPGLRAIMRGNFIMCPTLCYRREALGSRRFSPEWKQVQDLDFTSRLLLDGDTIVCSRTRAYAYRRHARGATALQSESRLRFDEEYALFDRVAEQARSRGWKRAARVARRKSTIRLHLAYRTLREILRLRPRAAMRWLRYLLKQR